MMFGTTDTSEQIRPKRRTWLCPGVGLAAHGRGRLAALTYLVALAPFGMLIALSLVPQRDVFLGTLAIIGLSAALVLYEQTQCSKAAAPPMEHSILTRWYVPAGIVYVLAGVLALAVLIANYEVLRLVSNGMAPAATAGERLIYHERVDRASLQPGDPIVYRNSSRSGWGEPGEIMIGRILAAPGDTIGIRGRRYIVNGERRGMVGAVGEHPVAVPLPPLPGSATVPPQSYFVTQDQGETVLDSQVLGWVKAENVLGTALFHFNSDRGFFVRVN